MGTRNRDRYVLSELYSEGRDVAHMAVRGWDVISQCRSCGLAMQVDLKLIAYVSGPRTSLWNRKARCRRLLCQGVVEFYAKPPGLPGHGPLRIDPKVVDADDQAVWRQRAMFPPKRP